MQTPMCCFNGSKDSPLNKLFNDLFYGKELIFHKATDPLVCFNRHALYVLLKRGAHFVYHVIFIHI